MSLADYADPPEIETGAKAYLKGADGNDTGDWLLIRSFRSAAFQRAVLRSQAALAEAGDDPDKIREAMLDRRASLVAGWSDDAECTPDAVKGLLRKSTRLAQFVDAFAAEDANFFGRALNGLSRGQSKS